MGKVIAVIYGPDGDVLTKYEKRKARADWSGTKHPMGFRMRDNDGPQGTREPVEAAEGEGHDGPTPEGSEGREGGAPPES